MGRGVRSLEELEVEAASDLDRKRRRRQRRIYPEGGATRIAKDTRKNKRLPPPVPEGLSLEEIKQLDPEDPRFRHPQGRPRLRDGIPKEQLSWKDSVRQGKQRAKNKRRAKIRRHEAEVIVAATERGASKPGQGGTTQGEIDQEAQLVQDGILSLEDWDNEEVIRGYRRNRNGKFGPPPKYIPHEVQQEVYRRLIAAGDREFKRAYIRAIKNLVNLADNAASEKVQLDANRELVNRVGGKVPDRVHIGRDEPWQEFLSDSIDHVRPSELPPLDVAGHIVEEDGGGVDAPLELVSGPAVARPARASGGEAPPSPTPRRRKAVVKRKTSAKSTKKAPAKRKVKVTGKKRAKK